jgi:hypothetical protein
VAAFYQSCSEIAMKRLSYCYCGKNNVCLRTTPATVRMLSIDMNNTTVIRSTECTLRSLGGSADFSSWKYGYQQTVA